MRSLLVLSSLLLAAPSFARSLDLEIVPDAKARPTVRFVVSLEVGDAACSSVRLRTKLAPVTQVEVCPQRTAFGVQVQLPDVELRASAPNLAGKRTVLGRFDRSDGTTLEVAITPH